ncbi:hypothetical protein [Hydrogenovibrio kuenenii]|uniref:hypothetical protein n=1 Tax=Hydrogenovibrio kuenenii TaxID=63658 RepID=UPI00046354A2|nr:hypothetical protein [Hydrogenovibrio kuenenii]
MSTLSFSIARIHDAPAIMQFMDAHWRKGHVLSWSRELLLKDFQDEQNPNQLNIGLVKDSQGELLGLFGFMLYNQSELPDMAGSLWKITDEAQKQYPMLGIQLRNFVIKTIPHRFFAAPGAGLQTQTIYQVIRMNWHRMQQFFYVNPTLYDYHLVTSEHLKKLPLQAESSVNVTLTLVQQETAAEQLSLFDFSAYSHIVPFKDQSYVQRRFFDYPFYDYDVYLVQRKRDDDPSLVDFDAENPVENLVVCRRAVARVDEDNESSLKASAYRIVDFYGEEALVPDIMKALEQKIIEAGDEYLDFICEGFDEDLMKQGGMKSLDFDSEEWIVPNFFEPLLKKSVPVYCVSDKTDQHFRQCKADGDQDRPNGVVL